MLPNEKMFTIQVVIGSIIGVFIVALIAVFIYNYYLRKSFPKEPIELFNTDIPIANGKDEIKIICK